MANSDRRAATTKIGGGADYAKVAERLKLFRSDFPHSKHESAYDVDVDGSLVFTVWLWRDKKDLLDLMKAGVIDKDALRASADANGNAKGLLESKEKKDFEKLESIALGRALANLGYLGSGEIASFEEMEEFERFKQIQAEAEVKDAIKTLDAANTLDELKKAFVATGMMENSLIVAAKDKRKSELSKTDATAAPKPAAAKTPPQKPAAPTETPTADPSLPLDEGQPNEGN